MSSKTFNPFKDFQSDQMQRSSRKIFTTHFACMNADSVSIKHGLRTADYGLRTGYKIRTRYKTRTRKYGLGIKHGQGIKRGLRTADWV